MNVAAPAGVAASPINLGLGASWVEAVGGAVGLTISGIPNGWSLSEGVATADGSWTVQTSDLSALTITSPASYNGALTLLVREAWTKADGSAGYGIISDNVEVFAKGAPIFAWSGDDTLTGSSGIDRFVFSQPIGHDVVHAFDVSHDVIDIIGRAEFKCFADVQSHLAEDAAGNAVLTLAEGQSVTLTDVHASELKEGNFLFDQESTTINSATIIISDDLILPFAGVMENSGKILVESTGRPTEIEVLSPSVHLEGGGEIILSDSETNVIFSASHATFVNIDNTISGAGQIGLGDPNLLLINEGTINANGTNSLIIATGTNAIDNKGLLESTGAGGLFVESNIANDGIILANNASVTLNGAVFGSGQFSITGNRKCRA